MATIIGTIKKTILINRAFRVDAIEMVNSRFHKNENKLALYTIYLHKQQEQAKVFASDSWPKLAIGRNYLLALGILKNNKPGYIIREVRLDAENKKWVYV